MAYSRAVEIDSGRMMVVTDLHGNAVAFDQIIETFMDAYQAGRIDQLLLCGDLIHANTPPDDSLRMVLEVMRLQSELGKETVFMLCGNHEMPHIYGQPLYRGDTNVTTAFETALSQSGHRSEIVAFLERLPFFVTTAAGVLFCHAGPTHEINTPSQMLQLLSFKHKALMYEVDAELQLYDLDKARLLYGTQFRTDYANIAREQLAVTDSADPRFNHLLRAFVLDGHETYDLLWSLLFSQCETVLPNDLRRVTSYHQIVTDYLKTLSVYFPHMPQHIVVSGHISTHGGHQVIDDHHLRLSSYAHAKPSKSGEYLLIDCAGSYTDADALVPHLYPVFP
jgi:hypothetical protein